MGRTIPSSRIALAMEEQDWKPFRNALDNPIERSLMRCGTFLDGTFQPAAVCRSLCLSIEIYCGRSIGIISLISWWTWTNCNPFSKA
jgi:hypothetical protein